MASSLDGKLLFPPVNIFVISFSMPNTSLSHLHQLPEKNVYGAWPKSGEIDVMETVGYEPYKF
jgi:hypothetical protein